MRWKQSLRAALAVALLVPALVVAVTASASAGAPKCVDYDIQYTDGSADVGSYCGDNDMTRDDVPGLLAVSVHVSCSDDLTNPDKSDFGGLVVEEWSIIKYNDDGSLDKTCGGGPDTSDPTKADCIEYDVTYQSGAVDAGLFCDGNEIDRTDDPSLNAVKLHISCSDNLSMPDKSDLGGLTVEEWMITKYDGDGNIEETCSGGPGVPTDPSKADCIEYDVRYTSGAVDAGVFCDGNTVTRDDDPDLNAVELHISCSDDLLNPSKSDLGGLTVDQYYIIKYDGDGNAKDMCGTPIIDPVLDVAITCTTVTISGNTPINGATMVFTDGTTKFTSGGGATELALTAPDGKVIDGVFVNGKFYDFDETTCVPPVLTVDITCTTAEIGGNTIIKGATMVFSDGTTKFTKGDGVATEMMLTAPAGKVIDGVFVNGKFYDFDETTCVPPVLTVDITCTTAEIGGNTIIKGATMVFSDGTTKFTKGDGVATEMMLTAPAGKVIDGVFVNGKFYDFDETTCVDPDPTLRVDFDCAEATITGSEALGIIEVEYLFGGGTAIDAGGLTTTTIQGTEIILRVTALGITVENPDADACYTGP